MTTTTTTTTIIHVLHVSKLIIFVNSGTSSGAVERQKLSDQLM